MIGGPKGGEREVNSMREDLLGGFTGFLVQKSPYN